MTKAKQPVFTKADLIKSKRYFHKRDILVAALNDDEMYTIEQVEKLIKTFLSKEVK